MAAWILDHLPAANGAVLLIIALAWALIVLAAIKHSPKAGE